MILQSSTWITITPAPPPPPPLPPLLVSSVLLFTVVGLVTMTMIMILTSFTWFLIGNVFFSLSLSISCLVTEKTKERNKLSVISFLFLFCVESKEAEFLEFKPKKSNYGVKCSVLVKSCCVLC